MAKKTFVFLNFLRDSPLLGRNWDEKARMARRRSSKCGVMSTTKVGWTVAKAVE